MTNEEMMRPCTLWGKTFDACDVKAVNDYLTFNEESTSPSMGYNCGVLVRDPFKGDIASPTHKNKIESYKAIQEAISTIAEALNAPVVLTKAVFENLPIDVYQLHYIASLEPDYIYLVRYNKTLKKWTFRTGMTLELFDVPIHKISGCNQIGKDYLLQFTLDGKRKETT